jgi:hypothetical protein
MPWLEDHVGKIVVTVFVLIASLVGAVMWTASAPQPSVNPETNTSTSETSGSAVKSGASRDPRTGALPPDFLVSFVEKLNEVNSYVYYQNPPASEQRELYRQLWAWAANGGLSLTGRDAAGKVIADAEAKAVQVPLLDIVTVDGNRYCAVWAGLLDPARFSDPIQALVASTCSFLLAK